MAGEWTRPNEDGGAGPREDTDVVGIRIDGSAPSGAVEGGERHLRLRTGIDERAKPTSEQARGANHNGGRGLGQPPADAIEASALRARPRWRGATRLTPAASLEPSSIFSAKSLHDSGDSVARLGDDRQTGPDFLVRGERT